MTEQQAMPQRFGNAIYGADAFVAKWVNEQIGQESPLAVEAAAIGFMVPGTDKLGAGIVYFDYRANDIEAGMAIVDRRAVNRDMISRCCIYPFRQLGCARVTVFVRKNHYSLRKIAARMGFKLEGVKRGSDVCMYGLTADDAAKWIRA